MQNGKVSDFVNARATFKGTTKDKSKDKITAYLGPQDVEALLEKLQATVGNPEGARLDIFIGKNSKGKDSTSFLVQAAQPRTAGAYKPKPVAFRPKSPLR